LAGVPLDGPSGPWLQAPAPELKLAGGLGSVGGLVADGRRLVDRDARGFADGTGAEASVDRRDAPEER